MKVELWLVGKTREPWVTEALEHYLKRCNRYATVVIEVISESKSTMTEEMRRDETHRLLQKLRKSTKAYTILLDEHGKQLTSIQFAELMNKQQTAGTVRFLIGGAYGIEQSIHSEIDTILALSAMTFPHQLVRVIFMEQLYRAFTILRGEKYHHE